MITLMVVHQLPGQPEQRDTVQASKVISSTPMRLRPKMRNLKLETENGAKLVIPYVKWYYSWLGK